MQQKTHNDYLSIANHFFGSHFDGKPNIINIQEALLQSTGSYTKKYWCRLRRAISYYFELQNRLSDAAGIAAVQYPPRGTPGLKPKQTRVKKVSQEEHERLIRHCIKKKDMSLAAALTLADIIGCRPAEMFSITKLSDNRIHISGAKKTQDGKRGLDRTLILPAETFKHMDLLLEVLRQESTKSDSVNPGRAMRRIQRRLENTVRKLWPRRKHHITLYSYRHQYGSDLKGSGRERIEIAAIMGHQSVNSADQYGDARSGKGTMDVRATQSSMDAVRVTELKRPDFRAHLNQHYGRKSKTKTIPDAALMAGRTVPL